MFWKRLTWSHSFYSLATCIARYNMNAKPSAKGIRGYNPTDAIMSLTPKCIISLHCCLCAYICKHNCSRINTHAIAKSVSSVPVTTESLNLLFVVQIVFTLGHVTHVVSSLGEMHSPALTLPHAETLRREVDSNTGCHNRICIPVQGKNHTVIVDSFSAQSEHVLLCFPVLGFRECGITGGVSEDGWSLPHPLDFSHPVVPFGSSFKD